MSKYKSPYFTLFSAVSDALETLENIIKTEENEVIKDSLLKECSKLKKAQLAAEEMVISGDTQ
ncbi:MAG: hypothetical protein J6B17_04560 [Ruminococcus sp.]|nr:hypothetical protein [Ruminococcus sp.]